ncbi:MAG TPA: phosphoglycerate dehydrogenase [Candidatus Limnocylindrales bacterium]|nr:phosphoglycerate dehydrogenase [Candidatus Limnocylindrales bacterium]
MTVEPALAATSGVRTAPMRILVAESIAPEGIDALRAAGHEVVVQTGLSPDELRAVVGDVDALIVRSQVAVDAELIAAGARLQVIGRAGVGVDNVDLDAATRAGITVVNAPTGNTIAAAEHTIALLLALARKVASADASMRRGEWARKQHEGVQLGGRTLGIIGLGKIGMAVAERARGLGMTLLGSDPYVTAEQAALRGVELVSMEALLERADAVTVHVPLGRGTAGLIDAKAIARMKPGAFVLNVARGGVIDEGEVAIALREGRLGGAGIDVFESEPPTGSPLLDAPNTVLTPHLGASTAEAQVAVAEEIAGQVLDVLAGRAATYAVNAPLLSPEAQQTVGPYLPLAETLGRFLAQFARGGLGGLTVELAGDLARAESGPVTAAVLRGILETATTERVNLVNAAMLAKARGIAVTERKSAEARGFSAAITVSTRSGGEHVAVGGTIAGGEQRLVRLNDYRLDMAASDIILITRHRDRPGTIGRLGQLIGSADVNINSMHLARTAPRADALMVLTVDDDVSPALEAAIRADEGVMDLWVIRLGPLH